jgi:outer membrane protein assembly factor BamB
MSIWISRGTELGRAIRVICLAAVAIFSVAAENWPQWRGPGLNGISHEKDLPVRRSRDENVAWKLPLPGWGGSAPIIWGDRIILSVAEREDLPLWCADRAQGAVLWEKHLAGGNFKIGKQNPSSPSPVTGGTYFYTVNDRGIAWRLDTKTGKEIWGPQRIHHATYSASPVPADAKIYITDGDGVTSVFKAGPKFELVAENNLNDYTLSSIAISGGQLFIRTAQNLYCIGERPAR